MSRLGDTPLQWHNRRVLAERLEWPAGALEECERLAHAHPRWYVGWTFGCQTRGWERAAGYHAVMDTLITWWIAGGLARRPWAYGLTPAELVERMAEVQEVVAVEETGNWLPSVTR